MSDAVVVAPVKVRVWRTIGNSFELVLGRLGLFFRVGWLPMLGMLALTVAQAVLIQSVFRQVGAHPPTAGSPPQVSFGWFGFFNVLAIPVQIILFNAFAVRWHRSVLSADPEYWRWRNCWPGSWRFMIYTIAIYVLWIGSFAAGFAIVAGLGFGATPGRPAFGAIGLIFIPLVVFAFCLVRLALIFPSAANARPLSVPEAWRQMRGNTWRLIGTVVLLGIILAVAVMGIELAASPLLIAFGASIMADKGNLLRYVFTGLTLLAILGVLANFIGVAFMAAVASIFYREIVLGPPLIIPPEASSLTEN